MTDLSEKKCVPCEGGASPLPAETARKLLSQLDGWNFTDKDQEIVKNFTFKNFYHTMNFVNAIAWIAHRENHHPDLKVGYNYCEVHYKTHAISGLSENDFICAAKVDKLFE